MPGCGGLSTAKARSAGRFWFHESGVEKETQRIRLTLRTVMYSSRQVSLPARLVTRVTEQLLDGRSVDEAVQPDPPPQPRCVKGTRRDLCDRSRDWQHLEVIDHGDGTCRRCKQYGHVALLNCGETLCLDYQRCPALTVAYGSAAVEEDSGDRDVLAVLIHEGHS
jgi:hypothetical protein